MREVKLEDLKKELGALFEDAIEEVVEDTIEKMEGVEGNEEVISDTTPSAEETKDNSASTVSDGGVFTAESDEQTENAMLEEIMLNKVEDIFSADNEEKGESQTIEKETDKPSSKFKSVEELEKAYNSLEKEFTKRCQKLSQLEKEMKVMKTETPEQWKAKVDKFFGETPDAKAFAKEMAEVISNDTSLRSRADCLEVALSRVLMKKYRSPKDLATDEEFLKEHILGSDFVKKAVIDRYMKDLRDGKPPVLMSRAGQNTVAPRNKPKTIADAGKLFQQNNR